MYTIKNVSTNEPNIHFLYSYDIYDLYSVEKEKPL